MHRIYLALMEGFYLMAQNTCPVLQELSGAQCFPDTFPLLGNTLQAAPKLLTSRLFHTDAIKVTRPEFSMFYTMERPKLAFALRVQ